MNEIKKKKSKQVIFGRDRIFNTHHYILHHLYYKGVLSSCKSIKHETRLEIGLNFITSI